MIGQYVPGTTFIHRLDPRTKLLALTAFVIILFMIRGFAAYALASCLTALVIAVARLPLRLVARSMRPILFLLVLTVIMHSFVSERDGATLLQLGSLRLTVEGLSLGVEMGWRIGLLIMMSTLLTLTTSPLQLTDGIEQMLRRFKRVGLPVHELAMMMTIALRFIPTLLEETERIMKAQMARGADWQTGPLQRRLRAMVPVLVPLFVSVFRRADELATAMEARCYRGGEGRTRLKALEPTYRDAVAALLFAAFLALLLVVGR